MAEGAKPDYRSGGPFLDKLVSWDTCIVKKSHPTQELAPPIGGSSPLAATPGHFGFADGCKLDDFPQSPRGFLQRYLPAAFSKVRILLVTNEASGKSFRVRQQVEFAFSRLKRV